MELISAFSVETILEFQVIRRLISVKTTSKARDNAALFVRRGLKAGNFEMTTPDKEEMPTDMTAAKLIRWPDTANIGVTEANGDIVWWAQISTLNPNTSVADLRNVADRIVTACNAYEPTREALQKIAKIAFDDPSDPKTDRLSTVYIIARAALSTLPVNDRHHSGSDSYQADASAPALSEKVNVRSESRDER